ncbi:MAG: C4-dicarboxylate ABC transporter permease, partial [Dermatophilaceae bacterium]
MSLDGAVAAGPGHPRPSSAPGTDDVDALVAGQDEENPQRRLGRRLDTVVTLYCFVVAVLVLTQVFVPLDQGNQFFLILFLGAVLPLVFVTYRARPTAAGGAYTGDRAPAGDNPRVPDWVLTVLALVVCLYPVLPIALRDSGGGFDAFLDRQGQLTPVDVVMGALLTLLVLEGCRRTTGLVLPIVCVVFVAFAYYGGFLPVGWAI